MGRRRMRGPTPLFQIRGSSQEVPPVRPFRLERLSIVAGAVSIGLRSGGSVQFWKDLVDDHATN